MNLFFPVDVEYIAAIDIYFLTFIDIVQAFTDNTGIEIAGILRTDNVDDPRWIEFYFGYCRWCRWCGNCLGLASGDLNKVERK